MYGSSAVRPPGGLFSDAMFAEIEDRSGHKLLESYGHKDGTGIIGGRVLRKGGSPVSKPSGIYWSALRTWGLLAPLESNAAPPYRSDLARHWDLLTRHDRPEVDAVSERRAIFVNPPDMPTGWTRKKGELSFDLDLGTQEDEKIRTGWSKLRDPEGKISLLSRLAALFSKLVRQLVRRTFGRTFPRTGPATPN